MKRKIIFKPENNKEIIDKLLENSKLFFTDDIYENYIKNIFHVFQLGIIYENDEYVLSEIKINIKIWGSYRTLKVYLICGDSLKLILDDLESFCSENNIEFIQVYFFSEHVEKLLVESGYVSARSPNEVVIKLRKSIVPVKKNLKSGYA